MKINLQKFIVDKKILSEGSSVNATLILGEDSIVNGSYQVNSLDYDELSESEKKIVDDFINLIKSK